MALNSVILFMEAVSAEHSGRTIPLIIRRVGQEWTDRSNPGSWWEAGLKHILQALQLPVKDDLIIPEQKQYTHNSFISTSPMSLRNWTVRISSPADGSLGSWVHRSFSNCQSHANFYTPVLFTCMNYLNGGIFLEDFLNVNMHLGMVELTPLWWVSRLKWVREDILAIRSVKREWVNIASMFLL